MKEQWAAYESSQLTEEVALNVKDFLENDQDWADIDAGVLDPILKCIQGDFTGRFGFLKRCEPDQEETDGTIIGGQSHYDVVKNPKNLSIYIEDPKMDEVHARLFCRKYADKE